MTTTVGGLDLRGFVGRPYGTGFLLCLFPTLKRWAIFMGPCRGNLASCKQIAEGQRSVKGQRLRRCTVGVGSSSSIDSFGRVGQVILDQFFDSVRVDRRGVLRKNYNMDSIRCTGLDASYIR